MIGYSIYINEKQLKKLQQLALEHDLPVNNIIQKAINFYLDLALSEEIEHLKTKVK